MNKLIVHNNADELSAGWDNLATSYFQKKEFLIHCEKFNPCSQRYYELYDAELISGAILYELPINIFSFAKKSFKLKTNVVGIPASVSSSGILGDKQIIDYIKVNEKGFTLGLNLKTKTNKFSSGTTLPTIIFKNRFINWEDYINSLRATYRRRINKATTKLHKIKVVSSSCSIFTEKIYGLYLNVYGKSDSKLEKLSMDFFKNLSEKFLLTTFYLKNKVIGWHITIQEDKKLDFFLCGVDYNYNQKYSIYHNILINILKKGIENKAELINFGQTTEEAKCRLGGVVEDRFMFAFHKNKIFNFLIDRFSSSLEYKYKIPSMQVFKV